MQAEAIFHIEEVEGDINSIQFELNSSSLNDKSERAVEPDGSVKDCVNDENLPESMEQVGDTKEDKW